MQQLFEILQAARADATSLVRAYKVQVSFVDNNLGVLDRQVKPAAQQSDNSLNGGAGEAIFEQELARRFLATLAAGGASEEDQVRAKNGVVREQIPRASPALDPNIS
jgi:hypothetical protein